MDQTHVVEEQVDAFNARDVERFVGCYSPDALVTFGLDMVLAQGHEAIRAVYGTAFGQSPDLHADVTNRMVSGPWVVFDERVTGLIFEGVPPDSQQAVVYHVENGKIARVLLLG